MLKGYIHELDEDPIAFSIDETRNIDICPPKNSLLVWQQETIRRDIISGELNDGRNIKFIGCVYNGRMFEAQGYVHSSENLSPDDLVDFSEIRFAGRAIDCLSGGVYEAFEHNFSEQTNSRMMTLRPRPWDELCCAFPAEICGQPCKIGINYRIMYNLRWGERQIGTSTSAFFITFPEKVKIEQIPSIYLAVYDFLAFISFRRNIVFDDISLWKQDEKGKTKKTAKVVIRSNKKEDMLYEDQMFLVTLSDLGEDLGRLFSSIARRRPDGIMDDLFIPEDKRDYAMVSPSKFLSCALSFEGEHGRSQPSKADTNESFDWAKRALADAITDSALALADTADTGIKDALIAGAANEFEKNLACYPTEGSGSIRKVKKYRDRMLDSLRNIDFTLEERFNNMLCQYHEIIDPYKRKLAVRMGLAEELPPNLGKVFADYRNEVGHGHPEALKPIHSYVFLIGRCLTYIMILRSASVNDEHTAKVIRKIFQ